MERERGLGGCKVDEIRRQRVWERRKGAATCEGMGEEESGWGLSLPPAAAWLLIESPTIRLTLLLSPLGHHRFHPIPSQSPSSPPSSSTTSIAPSSTPSASGATTPAYGGGCRSAKGAMLMVGVVGLTLHLLLSLSSALPIPRELARCDDWVGTVVAG